MCSKGLAKILLVAFNILFVILGAVCLGLGIWVYVSEDSFAGVLARVPTSGQSVTDAIDAPSLLENSAIGLMVGGGFMFLIGLMGCLGACKEWRLFLVIYAVVVTLILILQIAAGILAVFFQDTVKEKLNEYLVDTIKDNYVEGVRIDSSGLKLATEPIELGWDLAQFSFECCGANNYTDWKTATNFDDIYTGTYSGVAYAIADAEVPISCCKLSNPEDYPDSIGNLKFVDLENCLTGPNSTTANVDGCYESIKDKILKYSKIMMITGIVIGVIELLGVISACWLCRQIGKDKEKE